MASPLDRRAFLRRGAAALAAPTIIPATALGRGRRLPPSERIGLAFVGMGLFFAPMANVILSSVKPREEGQASGASNAIRELGGVFGVAVLAAIFVRNGSYASPQAFVDGMVPAVLIGAIVVALGAVTAFAIPRVATGRAPAPTTTPAEPQPQPVAAAVYVRVDE